LLGRHTIATERQLRRNGRRKRQRRNGFFSHLGKVISVLVSSSLCIRKDVPFSRETATVATERKNGKTEWWKPGITHYSAASVSCLKRKLFHCFTVSKVTADWHELLIPQRIMRPTIAADGKRINLRCSMQSASITASVRNTKPINCSLHERVSRLS